MKETQVFFGRRRNFSEEIRQCKVKDAGREPDIKKAFNILNDSKSIGRNSTKEIKDCPVAKINPAYPNE